MKTVKPRLHADGSITYWCVVAQGFRRDWRMPVHALRSLPPKLHERVSKHMARHGTTTPVVANPRPKKSSTTTHAKPRGRRRGRKK